MAEALLQAYNEYDVELFKAVTAEDFRFVDERGTTSRDTQASYFAGLCDMRHLVEPVGDPVVIAEDPFVVSVDHVITANIYPPKVAGERAPSRSSSRTVD